MIARCPVDDAVVVALVSCLEPGLRSIVRRAGMHPADEDAWSEATTILLERVARYDLARRPNRVAANLLLDTLHGLVKWSRRERHRRNVELLAEAPPPAATAGDIGSSHDVVAEAVAAGVLTRVDGRIVTATRIDGVPLGDVAVLVGLSYEAAKKRRQRAEASLVAWLDPERTWVAVRLAA